MLDSSLFPSSRHHGPLLLKSSSPARCSRTDFRYFLLFILRHIFPSVSVPYNLCPPLPLALRSFLRYGLPSVNVPIVVSCHAALRSPPFWFIGHNRRNFFKGYEGLDSVPTIFLFPLFFNLYFLALSFCGSSLLDSGVNRLWLSVLNRCLVVV